MRLRMNIVLLEPEIPVNTANIGRLCLATRTQLHLIEPLGYKLNRKSIEKANLDYDWYQVDLCIYDSWDIFCKENPDISIYYASTKAKNTYTDVVYDDNVFIMFGKESAGIPEEILVEKPERCVRIPMVGNQRSLNLSNSVAIVLYEALRQQEFKNIKETKL